MFDGLSFLKNENADFDIGSFTPNSSSYDQPNLLNMFEQDDSETVDDINSALKYIPPKSKQPQKTATKSWILDTSRIVNAFQLENGINVSLGLTGLALLRNPDEDASKLLLYKTKEHTLSRFELGKETKIYWRPPYLQYYDDFNKCWSLHFVNDDSSEFISKLDKLCLIVRAEVTKPETSLIEVEDSLVENACKVPEPVKGSGRAEEADGKKNAESVKLDAFKNTEVVSRIAKIGHQLPIISSPTNTNDSDTPSGSNIESTPLSTSTQLSSDVSEKIIKVDKLTKRTSNLAENESTSYSSLSSSFDIHSFAAELRMQNAELRLNMSKNDSKLDKIADSIDYLRLNSLRSIDKDDKDDEIIKLEEKVLELKKQNRMLLLQLSESKQMNKTTDDAKDAEISALHQTIEQKDAKIRELEQKFHADIASMENEKQELIKSNKYELEILNDLEKKISELEGQQQTEKADKGTTSADQIRSIMNQFYNRLYQSINGKDTLSSKEILKLSAELIRKETNAALSSNQ